MFLVIKRRRVLIVLSVSVIILGAAAMLLASFGREEPAFALPAANRVVLIDAGHGGIDAGASDNGVIEKDINLKIALKLQGYIEQSGGVAALTRDEDESTEDPNRKGGSYKKSDLTARVRAAEENNADIYVSIHMNKFNGSSRGAQVFYSANDDKSRILGEEIQQSLKDVLQDGNTREAKKSGDGSIFVLKNATVPAALVECGFLSNKEEARLLADDEYQSKVAWAIYIGITKYFTDN